MGEPWMTPTYDQGLEMIDNTYSEWTTINGVNGYKFFNKTDFSKYIFLHATGEWIEESLNSDDKYGNYLSTKYTKSGTPTYICRLQFYYEQSYSDLTMDNYSYSQRGQSVRAIRPLEW